MMLYQSLRMNEDVEVVDMVDAEEQVGEQQSQGVCVGNGDEKFNPLINKHKGVFKDSTGTYVNMRTCVVIF